MFSKLNRSRLPRCAGLIPKLNTRVFPASETAHFPRSFRANVAWWRSE